MAERSWPGGYISDEGRHKLPVLSPKPRRVACRLADITATDSAAPNAMLSGLFLSGPQLRQGQVGLHNLDVRLTHRSATDVQARTRVRMMSQGAQMPSAGTRACVR